MGRHRARIYQKSRQTKEISFPENRSCLKIMGHDGQPLAPSSEAKVADPCSAAKGRRGVGGVFTDS